ncbi:MAG: hypothetical protein EWV83_06125 [Microcystis sp. M_OC_Ca_00000000_S217Cul]|nr:MAG: hypothetical protein EWV83_06125 [Microcystis sp. M_OC_Ca_00000000_S217Cul]
MSIVFALERTNQLSLLPDKDLVDLCPPIEPYQVTKKDLIIPFIGCPNQTSFQLLVIMNFTIFLKDPIFRNVALRELLCK